MAGFRGFKLMEINVATGFPGRNKNPTHRGYREFHREFFAVFGSEATDLVLKQAAVGTKVKMRMRLGGWIWVLTQK